MRSRTKGRPRSRGPKLLGTLAAALAAATLAAGGCAAPESTSGAAAAAGPRTGGTAVIAAAADITGLNPLIDNADTFNQELFDALFLQLFEEQPDFADHPPTFAPELAADWEWTADRRGLLLNLRSDVRWSDGTPLTAADVEWTWRRQIDPDIVWTHAQSKQAIESVEALDEHRLRVRFTSPATTRLAELNEGHILPRHLWAELPPAEWRDNGGWFIDHLAVSGPFRLAGWRPAQEIVLERNPTYYRADRPRLDRVVFRILPERNSRLNQLLSGAVDYLPHLPAAAAQRIVANPGTRLQSYRARQYNFICWNLRSPLFADAEARRALTLAIDRQALVETLWYGYAAVGSSPIPSNVWAHHEAEPWPHDRQRARELLAARGWRPGADGVLERQGRRFSFELLTNADNRVRADAAAMIQEDLRRIGVEARPRQLEHNALVGLAFAHDFDAVILAIDIDTSLDLSYGFHSESIDGGLNFGGYSNPELDRLLEQARAATEPNELGQLLGLVQETLHREQPLTFLWEPQRLNGVSRRLQGVRPNPLSSLFGLEEWWLEPAE